MILFLHLIQISFASSPNPDKILKKLVGSTYWAAAPKGRCPVGHRGELPYVRPSFRPSPPPVGLKFALPALKFALPALKFALPALNLAPQASNQLSRLQISPPPQI